jgi:O-antigen/teichoic acid export membrane protein
MGLVKNSSIVIAGILIANALALIFHFVVGRMLGPADYGVFGALMALFSIIALPAGALSSAITKFTSRFNSNKEYGKIKSLRSKLQTDVLIFGAIMLLFIVLLSQNIADYLKISSNVPVMVVGFTLIFALILPINRGILQGMKKFKSYGFNTILESASRLILVFILLYFGLKVNGAILAYGLAYLVAFLLVFPHIREIKGKTEKLEMKSIYKFILLVLFVNLILQFAINAPTFFIKHYFSSEFTGFWTAALNLARLSLFVTGAISLVMFPEIAGEKDRKLQRRIFGKALVLTLLASIGVAIAFMIFGHWAILILYGKAYLPALPILEWMGLAMVGFSIIQLMLNYWLARRG